MSEYQEKFKILTNWVGSIIDTVKKDLKTEHLKKDRNFCKRYFLGKNFNAVTAEEMTPAYQKEITEGNEGLGEFICSRWLLKNSDLYDYFEKELSRINPDFEAIEHLEEGVARPLMEAACEQFGSVRTYIFSVLNSVTFPQKLFEELRTQALGEEQEQQQTLSLAEAAQSVESLQKRHERELAALTNKYDKKLSGLQKKYLKDMEGMKKQISTLTKKLNG